MSCPKCGSEMTSHEDWDGYLRVVWFACEEADCGWVEHGEVEP